TSVPTPGPPPIEAGIPNPAAVATALDVAPTKLVAEPPGPPAAARARRVTNGPSSVSRSTTRSVTGRVGPRESRRLGCAVCGSHFRYSQCTNRSRVTHAATIRSLGAWKTHSCARIARTTARPASVASDTYTRVNPVRATDTGR